MNNAQKAVETAESLAGTGIYWLGTGDCDTPVGGKSDCFGFAFNKCYNVRRHRPGFNHGPWASVEDDLNCNSAIEDAQHKQELFELVSRENDVPKPGDLIAYPTFLIKGMKADEPAHRFIGHIAIIVGVPAEWAWGLSKWAHLDVVQCRGPNGITPGIVKTNGAHWDQHDATWPKAQHRTQLLRVKGANGPN